MKPTQNRSLSYVNSFRDLNVYQAARSLSREIFQISSRFPKAETFSLTSQIRRSSRSIGAQIAEAWGKRRYEKHFISKLTDADAEQQETQHWIEIAMDCEYLKPEQANALLQQCESIGRMLGSMIKKSSNFCNPSHLKEPNPLYQTQLNTDQTPNTEYRIPNTEYRIPNTEYRIPNTEYRILKTDQNPTQHKEVSP